MRPFSEEGPDVRIMHVIVHIGTHKTGTSSIQQSLFDARDELLKHGILYPESGRPDDSYTRTGHHLLAWGLRNRHNVDCSSWDALAAELSKSNAHTAVISSEVFGPALSEEVGRIRQYLSPHEVSVIVYFRSHVSFALSFYKQFVQGRDRFTGSFRDFLSSYGSYLDYEAIFIRWREVFPDTKWLSFDDHKRDLVQSFVFAAGLPEGVVVDSPPKNISPSDAAIALSRHLNALVSRWPTVQLSRLRRAILRERHIGKVLVGIYHTFGGGIIYGEHERQMIRECATWPQIASFDSESVIAPQPYHDTHAGAEVH